MEYIFYMIINMHQHKIKAKCRVEVLNGWIVNLCCKLIKGSLVIEYGPQSSKLTLWGRPAGG